MRVRTNEPKEAYHAPADVRTIDRINPQSNSHARAWLHRLSLRIGRKRSVLQSSSITRPARCDTDLATAVPVTHSRRSRHWRPFASQCDRPSTATAEMIWRVERQPCSPCASPLGPVDPRERIAPLRRAYDADGRHTRIWRLSSWHSSYRCHRQLQWQQGGRSSYAASQRADQI
jgi:hypothetical protein